MRGEPIEVPEAARGERGVTMSVPVPVLAWVEFPAGWPPEEIRGTVQEIRERAARLDWRTDVGEQRATWLYRPAFTELVKWGDAPRLPPG